MTPTTPVRLFAFALGLTSSLATFAQPPAPSAAPATAPQAARGPAANLGALVSPEVAPDRRVTFRMLAPKATEVSVSGQWDNNVRHPMAKDERGVWSVTLGPLDPSFWIYNFTVDGIDIADPINPQVKLRTRTSGSLVAVPAEKPGLWEARPDVPHGALDIVWHNSKVAGDTRHFYVYTPPDYDPAGATRYPVLYLLHGATCLPSDWTAAGRANFMADNLIAAQRMLPMIIVMPSGYALPGSNMMPVAGPGDNNAAFDRYLTEEVIPAVEKKYRTAPGAANRAIMGLSMGGGQAIRVGLSHLELFKSVGGFSPATIADFDTRFAAQLADAAGTNGKLKLLWLGCGRQDGLFGASERMDASLTKAGIRHTFLPMEGVHNYIVWRRCFEETATQLFR